MAIQPGSWLDHVSRKLFQVLGRNGRKDIHQIQEAILVAKQRLLPFLGEESLRRALPLPENPSTEVQRHYHALLTGSEKLKAKLSENTPEAAELDRQSVMRKASFVKQFIYKNFFHKYILLPSLMLLLGLSINTLSKGHCASSKDPKHFVLNAVKTFAASPEILKGFLSILSLYSYNHFADKSEEFNWKECAQRTVMSSILSGGVSQLTSKNSSLGSITRLLLPILIAYGVNYKKTLNKAVFGTGILYPQLEHLHENARKQEVHAIEHYTSALSRTEEFKENLRACIKNLMEKGKLNKLIELVSREFFTLMRGDDHLEAALKVALIMTLIAQRKKDISKLSLTLFMKHATKYLNKKGLSGYFGKKTLEKCLIDAVASRKINIEKVMQTIFVKHVIKYLDKKGVSTYFDKKTLEKCLLDATPDPKTNIQKVMKTIIGAKISEVFTTVNPNDILNLIFSSLQDSSQGMSPMNAGIKLFNHFNDRFFQEDIQSLLGKYRLGMDIDEEALEQVYNQLNKKRVCLFSKQSFDLIWEKVLFPQIEEPLYQTIAKLGVVLQLKDRDILKVSKFVQLYVQLFFYETIHNFLLNPLTIPCESQILSDKDITKATTHSINLLGHLLVPTGIGSYAKATQAIAHRLFVPKQEKQQVAGIQPEQYGIGSYFPAHTNLSSVVSFSKAPNVKDCVSVVKGMIDESSPHMEQWRSIKESHNIQMVPTSHCAHTQNWRKKLIQAAEHNIVISGNYCGQKAFDEILELIEERLRVKPDLKVVIISSPNFVKDDLNKGIRNQTLINALKERYPTQFSVVYSSDVWFLGSEDPYKKSTNHTKYLGIDWGRYYIMGGSAIKDNFNMSGVDNIYDVLTDKENRELAFLREKCTELRNVWNHPQVDRKTLIQKNHEWIALTTDFIKKIQSFPHYSELEFKPLIESLTKTIQVAQQALEADNLFEFCAQNESQLHFDHSNASVEDVNDGGLVGMLVPGNFRDMDFVFSDPNDGYSSGRQLFLEMVRLAYRWEALNASHEQNKNLSSYTPPEVSQLPIFTGKAAEKPTKSDSVTHRLMKEPMPKSSKVHTAEVQGFEHIKRGSLEALYQGPEQRSGTNEFSSKTLELIRNAKRRIVFNHMYFCPTDEIMEALKEAVEKRGVKIEIITCRDTKNCPNSQKVFGPYNQWNWVRLANQIAPEHHHKVKVFLFNQRKKGLHKKVIVFDDEIVLAGSSNFGYKSLVTSSDHEVNFVAKSEEFARKTIEVCEEDKRLSREETNLTEISKKKSMQAFLYHQSRSLVN